MNLIYKGEGSKLENIDTKEGIIQVYVSAFNSKDSDGDVILPGAFTRTIDAWGPTPERKGRMWFLKNHNPNEEIAKPFEVKQDSYGLLFSVKLPQTTRGKDMLALYEEGHITEHSVGFVTIQQKKQKDYNEISEIKLYEGSAVLWGANENTPTVSIKSLTKDGLKDEFSRTIKSLKDWKGSEDGFDLLQIKLLQLQDFALALSNPPINEALTQDSNPQHEKAAADFLTVIETKLFNMKISERLNSTI